MLRQIIYSLLLVIISLSNKSFAQHTFYYDKYKHWTPELESLAMEGRNARAIVSLGSCYDRADGIPRDTVKAFNLFQRAAELGDFLALYNLGWYQYNGFSTNKNNKDAELNFLKAIEINPNFLPAYMSLSHIYEDGGYGVEANNSKAFEMYKKASELGDKYSLFKVGQYHEKGLLTGKPNYSEALKYYMQVKDYWKDHIKPAGFISLKIGEFYFYGHGVDVDLEKAIACFKESLDGGYYLSYMSLANAYKAKDDLENCFKSLLSGYEKGVMEVCNNLGDCYYYGRGTGQSYKEAYKFFEKGAETNPLCKYRQSVMLRKGEGVEKNVPKADMLLEQSANSGSDRAQYRLGCNLYAQKRYSEAIDYFIKALDSKYMIDEAKGDICRKLSICYRFGRGVEANEQKANEYNNLAASYGEPNSQLIEDWLHQL